MTPTLTALLTEYRLAFTAEALAHERPEDAVLSAIDDEHRRDAAAAALLAYLVAQESL